MEEDALNVFAFMASNRPHNSKEVEAQSEVYFILKHGEQIIRPKGPAHLLTHSPELSVT